MSKSIKEICEIIEDFSSKRGWGNDDPNQLLTSIFMETAELAENFQWQSKFKKYSEEEKKAIAFEIVDIINYLFRLANKSGIDIEKYWDLKMKKLEQKFPIGLSREDMKKVKEDYRRTGKNKLYD